MIIEYRLKIDLIDIPFLLYFIAKHRIYLTLIHSQISVQWQFITHRARKYPDILKLHHSYHSVPQISVSVLYYSKVIKLMRHCLVYEAHPRRGEVSSPVMECIINSEVYYTSISPHLIRPRHTRHHHYSD